MQRTGVEERDFWVRTVDRREQTDADFGRVVALIGQTRALDDTLAMAGRYAESAKAALAGFPAGPWREAMRDLADFAVSRTK
jgi:octaprenyl-diphosphate synthase